VSRDQDLYQLLSPSVCLFDPLSNGGMTEPQFRDKYGLPPSEWAEVKALAGCSSDNITGASRIGEATAVKYLRGDLHKIEGFRRKIIEAFYSCGAVEQNLKLTRLPFPGTPRVGPE
jgi:DNA polymerase-1